MRIAETSYVGLHLFCRISKHILPSAYTANKAHTNCIIILVKKRKKLHEPTALRIVVFAGKNITRLTVSIFF